MKKIWNIPSYPVYSLSTLNQDGSPNMNICTYAIPVSMKPKLYVVAVYFNTRTLENIERNSEFLLQILSSDNNNAITPLGRKSALKYNKLPFITKNAVMIDGYAVLNNCIGYLTLTVDKWLDHGTGDHKLALCSVVCSKTLSAESEVLTWTM
jgi:flavin reductase (DIM6/NTAB) family NADH-FMN oxidoreductase RutF